LNLASLRKKANYGKPELFLFTQMLNSELGGKLTQNLNLASLRNLLKREKLKI